MEYTKQFIEDAIEGGWKSEYANYEVDTLTRKQGDVVGVWFYWSELDINKFAIKKTLEILESEILLDPLAWKAVGKTRGWNGTAYWRSEKAEMTPHEFFMHNFIEVLFEGKTTEQALEAISK